MEAANGPEGQLRILMAAYSVLYLAFGLALLACPGGIISLINWITGSLGLHPPLDIGRHPFWAVVCVSLLLTLSLICYLAYRDIRNRQLVWIMIFAKYVSSFSLLGYLVFSSEHPPGFGLGALVDAFLGTLALVFLLRARDRAAGPGSSRQEDRD
jgi:TRAP-type uncharacterized transport system fused permease subunit